MTSPLPSRAASQVVVIGIMTAFDFQWHWPTHIFQNFSADITFILYLIISVPWVYPLMVMWIFGQLLFQPKRNQPRHNRVYILFYGIWSFVSWPLWGESTGDRWIPLTKASDAKFWCFLWSPPKQIDCLFDMRRHYAHYNVTVHVMHIPVLNV